METPSGTWFGTYRTEQYMSEESDPEMEILGSRSSLVFEQETLCPEEYLSELKTSHTLQGPRTCSLSCRPLGACPVF